MKKNRILLLYTSHTLGHKSIAENIGFQLERAGYEVRYADILEVQKGRLTEVTRSLHRFVTQYAPWLWSFLYTSEWFTNLTLPYRVALAAKHHQATLRLIQEFQPDLIITTQTTASAVVAYLKQKGLYQGKFGITFSDFHLHRYWLYFQADFYLANTDEQKEDMVRLGISADCIYVCGITLKEKTEVDVAEVRNKLGIGQGEKVVLVSNGSFGYGFDSNLVANLGQLKHTKVLVVTGRNKKAYEDLCAQFSGTNVGILGFYAPMDELYAVTDVFISKPGGLTVAEALRWHVPIMVVYMLPGQEELNYTYLYEKGLLMSEPLEIVDEVAEELAGRSFRKVLEVNENVSKIIGHPEVLLGAIHGVLGESKGV